MSVIQFVRNYDDLSTDRGFQFKFHCDKCGNGYMSSFQNSMIGTAGSLLRAAGDLFGGWASGAANSAYDIQRAVGGKAHDSALGEAVQEMKPHFRQCARCGQWVCPEVCWNADSNLCDACAPNLRMETAAAQAQAKADAVREQLNRKAQAVDYTAGVDMGATVGRSCGHCGVQMGSAKFCPECGTAAKVEIRSCSKCGLTPAAGVKFCPECGTRM